MKSVNNTGPVTSGKYSKAVPNHFCTNQCDEQLHPSSAALNCLETMERLTIVVQRFLKTWLLCALSWPAQCHSLIVLLSMNHLLLTSQAFKVYYNCKSKATLAYAIKFFSLQSIKKVHSIKRSAWPQKREVNIEKRQKIRAQQSLQHSRHQPVSTFCTSQIN